MAWVLQKDEGLAAGRITVGLREEKAFGQQTLSLQTRLVEGLSSERGARISVETRHK
jgi:hypothetical protein